MKERFFGFASKIGSSEGNQMIFSPEPVNFFASDKPRVEFPKVWESAKKMKT